MDQKSKQIEKIQEALYTIDFILKEKEELDNLLVAKVQYIKSLLETAKSL